MSPKIANLKEKVPQNVVGRYYVDFSCIYCDLCVEIAPDIFKEYNREGWAYVFHQPATPEEESRTLGALEACPTGSIGKDGDKAV